MNFIAIYGKKVFIIILKNYFHDLVIICIKVHILPHIVVTFIASKTKENIGAYLSHFSECIQKHLKAGNTECPQCGVKIQGKSLTRNSSYATMVQCISKIKTLLNGIEETQNSGKNKINEDADLLMSILDGVIEKDEKEYKKEDERKEKNIKTIPLKEKNLVRKEKDQPITKINKNKKIIEAKIPKKKAVIEPPSTKRFGLLLTGLSEDQKAIINSNLQNLSKIGNNMPFKIIKDYHPDIVSHIICACAPKSHCPRTLKYLLGIVGKSWVISFDWILECLEAGKLLNEDKYVVVGDEAVRMDTFACEKSRADPGHLFDNQNFYLSGNFIGPGPSKSDLINLIQVSGGTILKKSEAGAIVISDSQELKPGEYSYTWLFDSISCYEVKH